MRRLHPIAVQIQSAETEEWSDLFKLHALRINKSQGDETFEAGADRANAKLTFDIRYFKDIEQLRFGTQPFRIIYQDHSFKLVDYDDFMEQHTTVRLVGELYE